MPKDISNSSKEPFYSLNDITSKSSVSTNNDSNTSIDAIIKEVAQKSIFNFPDKSIKSLNDATPENSVLASKNSNTSSKTEATEVARFSSLNSLEEVNDKTVDAKKTNPLKSIKTAFKKGNIGEVKELFKEFFKNFQPGEDNTEFGKVFNKLLQYSRNEEYADLIAEVIDLLPKEFLDKLLDQGSENKDPKPPLNLNRYNNSSNTKPY
jgi:hypothetical protein